ncbi:MAG: hypothetical protein M3Q81_01365 [bacterium]|nr:hypothetical protein [bacterium]
MVNLLRRCDIHLSRHWPLLVILSLLIILRIPSFFEPYWYGDEGIYLTLGNAMRHGERLYAEIIDHKTPIIYYLAMTPTQMQFRILLVAWMLVTTTAFYAVSRMVMRNSVLAVLTTLLFMIATTIPMYEGHLPNGELFVMGFVMVAGWLWLRSPLGASLRSEKFATITKNNLGILSLPTAVGSVLFGLAVLTKVPALFDVIAFFSILWFSAWRTVILKVSSIKEKLAGTQSYIKTIIGLGLLFLLPILLSMVYFIARGSGQAYLDYGLLYNFRYAGSWQPAFPAEIYSILFSFMGKTAILAGGLLGLTLASRWLQPRWQWTAAWFLLALFASILSNRPYPHYFLQAVPPLFLLIGITLDSVLKMRQQSITVAVQVALSAVAVVMTIGTIQLLDVYTYPTVKYYQRWADLMTGRIDIMTYRDSFDGLMTDNYKATEIITQSNNPYLFIWGTNPVLYAQTKKVPTGRFTVSFHIKDFNAYEETMQSVLDREPTFIVVMNNEKTELPGLTEYLTEYYVAHSNFDNFTVWMRL